MVFIFKLPSVSTIFFQNNNLLLNKLGKICGTTQNLGPQLIKNKVLKIYYVILLKL